MFPVVEVQHTFYQPPLVRTLEKWRRSVPEGFEFTLKAWQLITHEASSPTYRRLREKLADKQRREAGAFRVNPTVMAAWQRTLDGARALRSRLILFQCPARFRPTAENESNLRAFFSETQRGDEGQRANSGLTFVWEPRGELPKLATNRKTCYVLFNNISMLEDVRRFQQLVHKRAGD